MGISRRGLITALGVSTALGALGETPAGVQTVDEVFRLAERWVAAKAEQTALVRKWQRAETKFFAAFKAAELTYEDAYRRRWPEVRQMKALDREIKQLDRVLDGLAREIRRTPATTPAGALAKIEIALRIQDRIDFYTHAWELMSSGRDELKLMIPNLVSN